MYLVNRECFRRKQASKHIHKHKHKHVYTQRTHSGRWSEIHRGETAVCRWIFSIESYTYSASLFLELLAIIAVWILRCYLWQWNLVQKSVQLGWCKSYNRFKKVITARRILCPYWHGSHLIATQSIEQLPALTPDRPLLIMMVTDRKWGKKDKDVQWTTLRYYYWIHNCVLSNEHI